MVRIKRQEPYANILVGAEEVESANRIYIHEYKLQQYGF